MWEDVGTPVALGLVSDFLLDRRLDLKPNQDVVENHHLRLKCTRIFMPKGISISQIHP
jgi:hypothetical protein